MDAIARDGTRSARVSDGRARESSSGGGEHGASRCPAGGEKARERRVNKTNGGRYEMLHESQSITSSSMLGDVRLHHPFHHVLHRLGIHTFELFHHVHDALLAAHHAKHIRR